MPDKSPKPAVYGVRLAKEAFTFCAAHFITYAGDTCEPLHGHNYRVGVEIEGPLDGNAYVLDFVATRDALESITRVLDHRVLLPLRHREIAVERAAGPLGGEEIVATFRDRRWVFPSQDCVLLPVENTTAELLARWIADRLLESLAAAGAAVPARLTVAVDECDGQAGLCRLGG